jgi:hypothetical protein
MRRAMTRVTEVILGAIVGFALIDAGSAAAQGSRVQSRTQAIVASFNKSKHAVKEKYGVRVEKYKEVRSEAVIKANARDYSGSYEVAGMGFTLDLRVGANGKVVATGYERIDTDADGWRGFTLRNARIEGALITATKVYANGATEPFEGVFINRTSFDSPKDRGTTTFGLGVITSSVRVADGVFVDRLFYQKK